VTVVDGEKAVFECHVAVTPAAEVYLVSIVREVEREMGSIGRSATKSSARRTDPHTTAAPLNNGDRERSAFCATRIDAHAADELCGRLELVAMTSRNAVLGNRRLAERRTANTWTGTDTGSGDYGGLSR